MFQKLVGIVLHSIKYNDSMNIVDIYTQQSGRGSYLVRVSRSRKSGVKTVLFQPLAFVEFEADCRPNAHIYPIRSAKSWFPFATIPYNPYKSAMALFLSEFLYRVLREEEENVPLFAYLENSIRWLDACEKDFSNFHLVFLIRLSRFIGLYPNTENYMPGCYFDMMNAQFTPFLPTHGAYLSQEESAVVPNFMRMNYETMHIFKMNRMQRNRCLTIINGYYRLHLPDFPVLKSIDVLKELFS
ncbi:MAG: DNA repair protein RecO [Phocaeicola sp.]|uniref:DNA repair protein RecO n=1 Tax=Phocaeicola TaxID=909656 RepID=UPI00234F9982|nr:DNA repair protein RecO [Phocaeicola oris]MCE2617290.1 DNA repair protein RecO [Phocaeicola oris]